jgi:hypothetical protein
MPTTQSMEITTKAAEPVVKIKKRQQNIPDYLLKEEIEGIKFYYAGYKQVLNKTNTLEGIMGASGIQSLILDYLLEVLYTQLPKRKYRYFTNESGAHLAHKSNLSFDLAIFDKNVATINKINAKYMDVAPKMTIEIDTEISLDGTKLSNINQYVELKTRKGFEYGIEKTIWIFTKPKKILVAENKPNMPWLYYDWSADIELIDGVFFNILQYMKEEGFNPNLF